MPVSFRRVVGIGCWGACLSLLLAALAAPTLEAQEFDPDGPLVPPRAQEAQPPRDADEREEAAPHVEPLPQPSPGPGAVGYEGDDSEDLSVLFDPDGEFAMPLGEFQLEWDEAGRIYDIDVFNPLRYLDLGIEWTLDTVNTGVNEVLGFFDSPDSDRVEIYGRYRHRYWEGNNLNLDRSVYDRDVRLHDALTLGISFQTAAFRIDVEFHHVVGTRTGLQEDLWDLRRLAIFLTGFEGDPIRFPIDFLGIWARLIGYVGRGPLIFGRGRLLGSDDWDFRGEAFDAVVVGLVDAEMGSGLTAFIKQPVRYERARWNEGLNRHLIAGVGLMGVDPLGHTSSAEDQMHRVLLRPGDMDTRFFPVVNPRERRLAAGFDLYGVLLYVDDPNVEGEPDEEGGDPPTGRPEIYNIGLRAGVLHDHWLMLEAEGILQLGRYGGNDVLAYYLHGEITVGFDTALPISLTGLFDLASGDSDPHDGTRTGFDPMFGISHARFGLLDLFGPRNLQRFGSVLRLQMGSQLALNAGAHYLRSTTQEDGVWGPRRGELVLAPEENGSESNELGFVIEASLEYHYSTRIQFHFGAAQFFPGTRFTRRGLDGETLVFYAAADIRF